MFDKITDYILVQNIVPANVCDKLIADTSEVCIWTKHQWQKYGLLEKPERIPETELDNATSTPEQNEILHDFISQAIQNYQEMICSRNALGTGVSYLRSVSFNRYAVGTLMKEHYDHIHSIFDGDRRGIPILSIVGNLNDDYRGGEFVFFNKLEVELKKGDILIFPSSFMYPHKVNKITEGTRYSFVTWAF
jgi:predicted 2-oxoglutarate/Fe(II)-dependent dioxygenase YbiX